MIVGPDKMPCGTVLESAKIHRNMKTGLVVKSRITHATPAAFSAHISWRDAENDIAEHQLGYTPLGRTVDLMLGGGLCEFLSNTTEGSCRMDNRDLLEEGKEDFGWNTIRSRQEFDQLDETRVELPLMGLFAPHVS
jgi:alkaline phosphatase